MSLDFEMWAILDFQGTRVGSPREGSALAGPPGSPPSPFPVSLGFHLLPFAISFPPFVFPFAARGRPGTVRATNEPNTACAFGGRRLASYRPSRLRAVGRRPTRLAAGGWRQHAASRRARLVSVGLVSVRLVSVGFHVALPCLISRK